MRRLEPAVSQDFEAAVLIGGQARARSPGRIARVLAEKAKARGAAIVEGEVKRIRPDGSGRWQVDLQGRSFASDRVVVSAGAWSAALLKARVRELPLIAERGYHLQFPDPGIALNHSVMDVERKFVASTMLEGLRVAGTSEFAALDAPPSRQRYRSLMRSARRLLPEIETGGAREWMGARPSFPDGLPVLGEFPDTPGLFGAFGHCHYGLMMAPKSGELVADLVAGRKINFDLSAFRADRF